MATRIQQFLVDDLDASTDGVTTHHVGLDGVVYEIDLSEANLAKLREALLPFVIAGRRLPKRAAAPRRGPGTKNGRSALAEIRDWWATQQQALKLPPHRTHGSIPQQVYDAHKAAH